ncbi:RICIN domain-containing protein, partial [Paenibacillus larvae]
IKDEDGKTKSPERQRLLRWDRRPPNEILVNGFIPQVINETPNLQDTDLFGYVKSNTKSIFVSTTKTKYKNGKRYQPWSPRTRDNGVIYQYEIFAPGGIDVNNSFGDRSPWSNQLEVAFPGGIRPEFIRSVRELHNGRIQRIWINPNFQGPSDLEGISASSKTSQVMWHPDHPDGNHKDPNAYRSFNPDEDMFGGNGEVPDEEDLPVYNESRLLPDGEYQIKSSLDQNVIAELASDEYVKASKNYGLDKQKWKFTYDSSRQAYIIKSSDKSQVFTWDSQHSKKIMGYYDQGNKDQYWKIERTEDGFYKFRNYYDSKVVLDLQNSNTSSGTSLQGWEDNGTNAQKWLITPVFNQTIENGEYQIKSSLGLTVELSANSDGGLVTAWYNYYGLDNQKWNFIYDSNKRAYKIKSAQNPNLLLTWNSNSSEKFVRGYTESGENNQYWRTERTDDGFLKFRNLNNPKMVLSKTRNVNAALIVQEDDGAKEQKWLITPVINQTIEDGEYVIKSSIAPNKVADLTTDRDVITYDNHYGNNQKWRFTFNKDKQAYRVVSVNKPDLAFAWDSNHSGKIIGATGDYDDQYWRLVKTSDGYFTLRNYKDPKMVLDVPNSNPNNDVQLQAYEDNGTKAQKWSLQRADAPIIPNGTYNISSIKNYKKVIQHDYDNHKAVIWDHNYNNHNNWDLIWDSSNKAYKIRNQFNKNLALTYQGVGKTVGVTTIHDETYTSDVLRQLWTIEYDNVTGGFLIRSLYEPSQALDLRGDSLANGTDIITYKITFNEIQMWNLMPRKSQ